MGSGHTQASDLFKIKYDYIPHTLPPNIFFHKSLEWLLIALRIKAKFLMGPTGLPCLSLVPLWPFTSFSPCPTGTPPLSPSSVVLSCSFQSWNLSACYSSCLEHCSYSTFNLRQPVAFFRSQHKLHFLKATVPDLLTSPLIFL